MNSSEDILTALKAGRKIEAIKLMREQRGLALKEAKEEVEKLEARMREQGELPAKTNSGCGSSAMLVMAGFMVFGWAISFLAG
jgi:hypothetical protein